MGPCEDPSKPASSSPVPQASVPNPGPRAALLARVREWSGVEMRGCPAFPTAAPQYPECYLDPANPVYAPFMYLTEGAGSRHRVEFLRALNAIVGVDDAVAGHVAELVQAMHTCSLMVDDVVDASALRRGRPAAHVAYGVPRTLGSAYTTLFQLILSVAITLGEAALLVITEECARMHHCNTTELCWRETAYCPTEREYLQMVDGKTGSGFRVVTRLLASIRHPPVSAHLAECLQLFAEELGRFFQVRDDYLDLVDEEYCRKKGGVGSDLRSGTWSYPVILCIAQSPNLKDRFAGAFASAHPTAPAEVTALLELLHSTGSLESVRRNLQEMADRLLTALDELEAAGHAAAPLRRCVVALVSSTKGLEVRAPSPAP